MVWGEEIIEEENLPMAKKRRTFLYRSRILNPLGMIPGRIKERYVVCPHCNKEGYYEYVKDGDVCVCSCGKKFIFVKYK